MLTVWVYSHLRLSLGGKLKWSLPRLAVYGISWVEAPLGSSTDHLHMASPGGFSFLGTVAGSWEGKPQELAFQETQATGCKASYDLALEVVQSNLYRILLLIQASQKTSAPVPECKRVSPGKHGSLGVGGLPITFEFNFPAHRDICTFTMSLMESPNSKWTFHLHV